MSFALAESFGRGVDTFSTTVKSGDFDRILLRPRSTAFQVATRELQFLRAGRLAVGLVMLAWAAGALDVGWTAAKAALLVGAVAGGACVFYGLLVLQATLCFWTVESLDSRRTAPEERIDGVERCEQSYRMHTSGLDRAARHAGGDRMAPHSTSPPGEIAIDVRR
ncbi:ABC-2 family transporter protein [Sorangium sp. So ce315]|uniref:ABC-2 family transporter protein n=1 Tax=Sorangium sp. So ce315 TaxID=3133299 RepID=UPI003F6041FB